MACREYRPTETAREVIRIHACGAARNTLVFINDKKLFVADSKNNALVNTLSTYAFPEVPVLLILNSKTVYNRLKWPKPRDELARALSHVQYKVELETGHDPRVVAEMETMKVYLKCPYKDKDACKELGGVWCPRHRSWYTFRPIRRRFKWRTKKICTKPK